MTNKDEPIYLWTDKMCVASLVCGLLFFIPFAPLLAILFGIIGFRRTVMRSVRGRGMAVAGLILGCLVLVVHIWGIFVLRECIDHSRRTTCQATLTCIGRALHLYADENSGKFPPNLEGLKDKGYISELQMICIEGCKVALDGDSVMQLARGNGSYLYLGDKLKDSQPSPKAVLLYEPLSNHNGKGLNCLCLEGRAFWIDEAEGNASKLIRELEAGQNPPPSLESFRSNP